MKRSRRVIGLPVVLTLALAAGAASAAGFRVDDARERPARAESRNTGGGAELVLAERRISPRLPQRLERRLAELPQPAADVTVQLRRAEAVLFIDGAFATPGQVSSSAAVREIAERQWPDELTVLRDASPTAKRRYTVYLEGEVAGRAFTARGEADFSGEESRRHLERAIVAALDDAARQIGGG
jgi:hypothetical protein